MHGLHLHIMYVSTSKEIRKNRVNKAQAQPIDRFHGTLNTSFYKYHVCSTSCHKCMLKNLNRFSISPLMSTFVLTYKQVKTVTRIFRDFENT